MKGAETQKGASGSEPNPLGMSHVLMQTSPSFQQIEQHPPQAFAVAKPLTVSTLLPPPFADSTRETMVVCIGQNSALQAVSGFEHQLVCPRKSGLGPTLEFASDIQL